MLEIQDLGDSRPPLWALTGLTVALGAPLSHYECPVCRWSLKVHCHREVPVCPWTWLHSHLPAPGLVQLLMMWCPHSQWSDRLYNSLWKISTWRKSLTRVLGWEGPHAPSTRLPPLLGASRPCGGWSCRVPCREELVSLQWDVGARHWEDVVLRCWCCWFYCSGKEGADGLTAVLMFPFQEHWLLYSFVFWIIAGGSGGSKESELTDLWAAGCLGWRHPGLPLPQCLLPNAAAQSMQWCPHSMRRVCFRGGHGCDHRLLGVSVLTRGMFLDPLCGPWSWCCSTRGEWNKTPWAHQHTPSSLSSSLTAGQGDGADDTTEAKLLPCPRLGSGQRA